MFFLCIVRSVYLVTPQKRGTRYYRVNKVLGLSNADSQLFHLPFEWQTSFKTFLFFNFTLNDTDMASLPFSGPFTFRPFEAHQMSPKLCWFWQKNVLQKMPCRWARFSKFVTQIRIFLPLIGNWGKETKIRHNLKN